MKPAIARCLPLLLALGIACRTDIRPARVIIGIGLAQTDHPAVELAARDINAAGGIDGVPLELMGLDWRPMDAYNARAILEWGHRFAETKNLVAVIGHSDSASTLSAAALYNQQQVPQIVTIATSPAITRIGEWTYRLCLSDDFQGPALADYAVSDWKKKRIALFYVNDAYGMGLAERFERRVKELNGEIVCRVPHRNLLQPDDHELIRSTLTQLRRSSAPDLIALFQRTAAATWTVHAIREAGLRCDILGGDNLSMPEFLDVEPELKERLRASQFFFLESQNKLGREFEERLRRIAKVRPDYGKAFAYDAVYLVRDAMRSGGFSRQGVKSYLDRLIRENTEIRGVTGSYRIGSDHDARRPFFVVEVRGGAFQLVKSLTIH